MRHVVVGAIILTVACGARQVAGPSSIPTPLNPQSLIGHWQGPSSVTSIVGGECVGPTLADKGWLGTTMTLPADITERPNGSLLLTAEMGWQGNPWRYSGGPTSPWRVEFVYYNGLTCTSGAQRQTRVTASTITGTFTNGEWRGTIHSTYDVLDMAGVVIAQMTAVRTFTLTKSPA